MFDRARRSSGEEQVDPRSVSDGGSLSSEAWHVAERERLVDDWRACCRFASVSADAHPELLDLADWLEERAASTFDRVHRLDVPGNAPVLLGILDGTGPSRLMLYSHYDVQPAGDEAAWRSPPFAAESHDGVVVARGCCDDKSDVMARLHAVETFRARHGRPSFGIVWLSEGAEEIGSPGLLDVLTANSELVAADGCLWESYLRRFDGRPEIAFGCRGILYVELTLDLAAGDRHGVFSSAYRSASVELVRALASIVGDGTRVAIDGFYDGLTPLDQAILETSDAPVPASDDEPESLVGGDPNDFARRLLFEPGVSIAGLDAGYTGEGIKTIVPARARAKLDIRLLPGQDPDDVLAKLRTHLDRRGFGTIDVVALNRTKPAVSSGSTPLAESVLEASAEVFGVPIAYPVAGAGPIHVFTDGLGIPVVMPAGTSRPDCSIHAPNENAREDDYLDHVRFTTRLLERLHERGGLT